MRIARVFPTKTNMTPIDKDAYCDVPDLYTPMYDEVHISIVFTWDIARAESLQKAWFLRSPRVIIGGPAVNGESDIPFVSGMYLRKGITITSRGCPNNCNFCMVRRGLIEFDDFPEGNYIQDNNILACSDRHWGLVMSMLRKQKGIHFTGGLEKYRVTPRIADDLRSLSIHSLWLSCDQSNAIKPLQRAVEILLRAGFTRSHLYCYVLIGDNAKENIHRLREVWKIGCMPFAQLYKPGEYSKSWKRLQRRWSKPMIVRSRMKYINNKIGG